MCQKPIRLLAAELTVQKKIGGTLYIVDGSYEGTETLDCNLRRIMARNMEDSL